jgi:hypothetical protein
MVSVYLRPNPFSISNTGIILYTLAERVALRRFLNSMIYSEPWERNLLVRMPPLRNRLSLENTNYMTEAVTPNERGQIMS